MHTHTYIHTYVYIHTYICTYIYIHAHIPCSLLMPEWAHAGLQAWAGGMGRTLVAAATGAASRDSLSWRLTPWSRRRRSITAACSCSASSTTNSAATSAVSAVVSAVSPASPVPLSLPRSSERSSERSELVDVEGSAQLARSALGRRSPGAHCTRAAVPRELRCCSCGADTGGATCAA